MSVTLTQTWVIRCDKRGCERFTEHSGDYEDARVLARAAGWRILSRLSVRCPDHPRGQSARK